MSRFACGLLAAALLWTAGCTNPLSQSESIYTRYYATTLGLSTSSDVLEHIQDRDTELLSQSNSVVAAFGSTAKERTHWFNIAAFDQDSAVAVRKYGFVCEENNRSFNQKPHPAVRLDAELLLDEKTLNEPYANANARQIAVLQKALFLFGQDALEVSHDSAALRSSVAMAKQAVNSALNKLVQSPAEAARLAEMPGMAFDHISLGESRIRMLIDGQKVKIKIKSGKQWFETPFETHPDVRNM